MTYSHLYPAFVLVAFVGAGGCAETLSQFEPAREVVCLQSAKIALPEAVATAEQNGGKAIAAHYHQSDELGCLSNKPGRYDVTLLTDGRLESWSVDARSGAIAPTVDRQNGWEKFGQSFGKIFATDPAEQARIAPVVPFDLAEAIAVAETPNGKVMKAEIGQRNGMSGYAVKLVERGRVREVWVDNNSHAILLASAARRKSNSNYSGNTGIEQVSFVVAAEEDLFPDDSDAQIDEADGAEDLADA